MRRLLPCVAMAMLLSATSAFAAEFYVVQNADGGPCSVVNKKPDGVNVKLIGGVSYKNADAANKAMAAAPECKK